MADTDPRPTAYIIRSRFQPCLRAHYSALKALILGKPDEFKMESVDAIAGAVAAMMIVREFPPNDDATGTLNDIAREGIEIRYWPEFNPLSGADVVRHLESAMWAYHRADHSLEREVGGTYERLDKIFAHSVFPIQMPATIKDIVYVLRRQLGIPKSNAEKKRLEPGFRPIIVDNLEMFNLVSGHYRPCWYFPLIDRDDVDDAKNMARAVAKMLENANKSVVASSGLPLIVLGDLETAQIDKRYAIKVQDHILGAYGVLLLKEISQGASQNEELSDFLNEEGIDRERLDHLFNLLICPQVQQYLGHARDRKKIDWDGDGTSIIDGFYKWVERLAVPAPCSDVLAAIQAIFRNHGLPESLVASQSVQCDVAKTVEEYLDVIEMAYKALSGASEQSLLNEPPDVTKLAEVLMFIKSRLDGGPAKWRLPVLYDHESLTNTREGIGSLREIGRAAETVYKVPGSQLYTAAKIASAVPAAERPKTIQNLILQWKVP